MDGRLTPEALARRVADEVVRYAEPIAAQHGGGHRLDPARVYEEALKAIRAAVFQARAGGERPGGGTGREQD